MSQNVLPKRTYFVEQALIELGGGVLRVQCTDEVSIACTVYQDRSETVMFVLSPSALNALFAFRERMLAHDAAQRLGEKP